MHFDNPISAVVDTHTYCTYTHTFTCIHLPFSLEYYTLIHAAHGHCKGEGIKCLLDSSLSLDEELRIKNRLKVDIYMKHMCSSGSSNPTSNSPVHNDEHFITYATHYASYIVTCMRFHRRKLP